MTRLRSRIAVAAFSVCVCAAVSVEAQSDVTGDRAKRIALWGSSVPNGTGDESNQGGYTGRLRELLEPRGWKVINVSRGGDSTITITPRFEPDGEPDSTTRYLTLADSRYVVIALSLGNEDIKLCAPGEDPRGLLAGVGGCGGHR